MNLVPRGRKQRKGEWDDVMDASPLTRFRHEVDSLFDRFFGSAGSLVPEGFWRGGGWTPSLDISETDTEITLRAEIPGVDPKDIDITVSGQTLTIAGQKKDATEQRGENFYHSERRFGSFRWSVPLPASADPDKIPAQHDKGVLYVRLAKRPGAQPKRIPVKSGD